VADIAAARAVCRDWRRALCATMRTLQPATFPEEGLAAAFLSLRRLDLSRLDPFNHNSGLTGLAAGEAPPAVLDLEGVTVDASRLLPALVCQDFEARPQDVAAWPHCA